MSYTFTPKPGRTGAVRGRGARGRGSTSTDRGRGRGVGRGTPGRRGGTAGRGNMDLGAGNGRGVDGEQGDGTSPQKPASEDRMQRRDAYTVIAPNQDKRNAVAAQAQKEEKQYKAYKDSQKLSHVSYHGTVGGGEMSKSDAREKAQSSNRTQAGAKKFGAKAQYKESVKKREEDEITKKKEAARRKTEENRQREEDRKNKLDEDRRRMNDAFLAKLERKGAASSSTAASRSPPHSSEPPGEDERQQNHDSFTSAQHYPREMTHEPQAESAEGATSGMSAETRSHVYHDFHSSMPLQQLMTMFPNSDPDALQSLLEDHNNNVDMVADLMLQ